MPVENTAQIKSPRTFTRRQMNSLLAGSAAALLLGQQRQARAESLPSRVIDGLTTYGYQTALTQEQLDQYIREANLSPLPKDPLAYYQTYFIKKTFYGQFPIDNDLESPQSFLVRHNNHFSQMLKDMDPRLSGGFVLRRLMVLSRIQLPIMPDTWIMD